MMFNATFNNILVMWWQSGLLVEKTRVPRKNHRPAAGRRQTLSHNVVSSTPCLSVVQIHNVNSDRYCYMGSYKSNCHTITTAPERMVDIFISTLIIGIYHK